MDSKHLIDKNVNLRPSFFSPVLRISPEGETPRYRANNHQRLPYPERKKYYPETPEDYHIKTESEQQAENKQASVNYEFTTKYNT